MIEQTFKRHSDAVSHQAMMMILILWNRRPLKRKMSAAHNEKKDASDCERRLFGLTRCKTGWQRHMLNTSHIGNSNPVQNQVWKGNRWTGSQAAGGYRCETDQVIRSRERRLVPLSDISMSYTMTGQKRSRLCAKEKHPVHVKRLIDKLLVQKMLIAHKKIIGKIGQRVA